MAFVSAAATSTKTVTKSVTAGSLLVVCFAGGDGTSTPTISDGVNTWTAVTGSPILDTTNAASASMWWAIAATTASITVTITATPTTFNGTALLEYSGMSATPADSGAGTANIPGNTGANAMLCGNFSTGTDGDLIVSFIVNVGSGPVTTFFTAGTSPITFTKRATASVDPAGASDATYAVQDGTQTTHGAINPAWTEAANVPCVGLSAAFKVSAGAAAPTKGTTLALLGVGN